MVPVISKIFTSVFQVEHISSIKFVMGYEKNMSFPLIKILKSYKKESENWTRLLK